MPRRRRGTRKPRAARDSPIREAIFRAVARGRRAESAQGEVPRARREPRMRRRRLACARFLHGFARGRVRAEGEARMRSGSPLVAAALAALAATGCAFVDVKHDVDRTPTIDTGVGGAIFLPSDPTPVLAPGGAVAPGGTGASESGNGRSSQSQSGGPTAAASPRMQMIGGSQIDEEQHVSIHEEPPWWKYVTLPFALAAAPFKIAADTVRGTTPPAPGPQVPDQKPKPAVAAPPPPRQDYESARVDELD